MLIIHNMFMLLPPTNLEFCLLGYYYKLYSKGKLTTYYNYRDTFMLLKPYEFQTIFQFVSGSMFTINRYTYKIYGHKFDVDF